MKKEEIIKALEEQRKNEKRKFVQSVDLIFNLKNFDIKRESVNLVVQLPHRVKDLKTCAFFNAKSKVVDTITKAEFERYKEKKNVKRLVSGYDLFIAHASLMPAIATTFGKYLGPAGKMPNPQLGILTREDDAAVNEVLAKASRSVRLKTKEPSIKVRIAREDMKDNEIEENMLAAYNALLAALPRGKDNLRSVMIKFTMNKPTKIGF